MLINIASLLGLRALMLINIAPLLGQRALVFINTTHLLDLRAAMLINTTHWLDLRFPVLINTTPLLGLRLVFLNIYFVIINKITGGLLYFTTQTRLELLNQFKLFAHGTTNEIFCRLK